HRVINRFRRAKSSKNIYKLLARPRPADVGEIREQVFSRHRAVEFHNRRLTGHHGRNMNNATALRKRCKTSRESFSFVRGKRSPTQKLQAIFRNLMAALRVAGIHKLRPRASLGIERIDTKTKRWQRHLRHESVSMIKFKPDKRHLFIQKRRRL